MGHAYNVAASVAPLENPQIMVHLPAASEVPFPRSPWRFEVTMFLYVADVFTLLTLTFSVESPLKSNVRSSLLNRHQHAGTSVKNLDLGA